MTTHFRRGAALLGALLVVALGAPPASADSSSATTPTPSPTATTSYATVDSEFAITVSPTRLIVGQQDIGSTQQLLVVNQGTAAQDITVQKRAFTGGTDGSLVYQEDSPFSAAEWVAVDPAQFSLQPGESRQVLATITAPANPEPGDHQVAIVFLVPAPAGPAEAGNIRVNRGVATPLYVTVPGPVDDSAALLDVRATGFAISGPVMIDATVENTGTVHRDFRGSTALRVDSAGSAPAFADFTVPRDASRNISVAWDPPLFCICHPSVTFTNADGSVQTASVRVVVIPLHLIGFVIGGLLLVWFGVWFYRRRFRASVAAAAAAQLRTARPLNSSGDG